MNHENTLTDTLLLSRRVSGSVIRKSSGTALNESRELLNAFFYKSRQSIKKPWTFLANEWYLIYMYFVAGLLHSEKRF